MATAVFVPPMSPARTRTGESYQLSIEASAQLSRSSGLTIQSVKSSRVGGGPAREKKPRVGVGPPGERKEEVEVFCFLGASEVAIGPPLRLVHTSLLFGVVSPRLR